MATIIQPIRTLLKNDTDFQWLFEQDKAFQEIKNILTKEGGPVLKYFDVTKPITISCDASPTGLGAVLPQKENPVAYTSRSLTDSESRYAQIEKELLAVQFSLERFNQYTHGKNVIMIIIIIIVYSQLITIQRINTLLLIHIYKQIHEKL